MSEVKRDRRLTDSKYVPKDTWLVYGGRNLKAIYNFKKFIEKVVIFQNFELMKEGGRLQLSDKTNKHKPVMYSDFIKQAQSHHSCSDSEKSLLLEALKGTKKTKKYMRENNLLPNKITDKDIARVIYKNASTKSLNNVKQIRKRLKQYNLL